MSHYATLVADDRREWAMSLPTMTCMNCTATGTDIHEIERRSAAPRNWWHRCNALWLCRECHDGEFAAMPHARQLAIKLLRDPDNFSLELWLRLADPQLRAPERVTWADISKYLRLETSAAEPQQ